MCISFNKKKKAIGSKVHGAAGNNPRFLKIHEKYKPNSKYNNYLINI